MNDAVAVSLIAVLGSIIGAALTYYFTKKHELSVQLRNEKVNHYKVLLSALSDLAIEDSDKAEANKRFTVAVNTIALVAPEYVIDALMIFLAEIRLSNTTAEKHDKLLNELLLLVRKDIGLARGDNKRNLNFHLIGSSPKRKKNNFCDFTPLPAHNAGFRRTTRCNGH